MRGRSSKVANEEADSESDNVIKGMELPQLHFIEVKSSSDRPNGFIPSAPLKDKDKATVNGFSHHEASSGDSADSFVPHSPRLIAENKAEKVANKKHAVMENGDVENQVQQGMGLESVTGEGSVDGGDFFDPTPPKDARPPQVPRPDPQSQYPAMTSLPLPSVSRQNSGVMKKPIEISFSPSPAP